MIDLVSLVDWLGPEGAIAGLEKSDLSVAELIDLAEVRNIPNRSKLRRTDLIKELVRSIGGRIKKTADELMQMDADALKQYLRNVKASNSEIIDLLLSLDIRPGSEARKNLADFAAREISDIGMYSRVAKGEQRKN